MFIAYPDARLGLKAPSVDATDPAVQGIAARLLEAARVSRAYGLAAAHIGENAAIIVINVSPEASEAEHLVMYNPRITASSPHVETGQEASVSLEGVQVDIQRPQWVDVQFDDYKGQSRQLQFEGFVARCVAHEVDQINGIFFLQHLSKLKRDVALRKYFKAQKQG